METYLVAVAITACVYILLAHGLNLHFGFAGLINFGHVGFYAIGGYCSALLTLHGVPFWAGFAAGMLAAAVSALPLGLCAIRLRDDYLAIVSLGFSEIVRIVITGEQWLTGGTRGLPGIPRPFATLGPAEAEWAFLAMLVLLNLAVLALVVVMMRSPFGRLVRAIRDDEIAVRAIGKSPALVKIEIFVIGAAIAGLAGAVYVHYVSVATPEQFLPVVTFYVWAALIMGGAGRIGAPVVGSVVIFFFLEG